MWEHAATQRNIEWLKQAGVHVMQPDEGEMACGEFGPGRLPEPEMVWLEIAALLGLDPGEAGAIEVAEYLEALEPEDEPEPADGKQGGLAGLLASIIPRSTPRRIADDEVTTTTTRPDVAEPEGRTSRCREPSTRAAAARARPGGRPVLVAKGKAKAAPPTDPRRSTTRSIRAERARAAVAEERRRGATVRSARGPAGLRRAPEHRPLFGKHVLVTAGPTHEPIDPVRYIANRSSGKQGYAIAAAAGRGSAPSDAGFRPGRAADAVRGRRIDVESAEEMAAAVKKGPAGRRRGDGRRGVRLAEQGIRPREDEEAWLGTAGLLLKENPDILATTAGSNKRPKLLIGFAAETEDVVENATRKRKSKGVDWIVANDVKPAKGKGKGRDGAATTTPCT
jgi:phosphopantothenoylcysteine decarboxylase/phosphopantothenate--cysteine ligase